jgi:hypothetical protein
MNNLPARIAADGHVHIYPQFRLERACDCLLANLDRNAGEHWQCDPQDTVRLAFLTERADCNFFEQLRSGAINATAAGLEIIEPREELCLTFLHRGGRRFHLVAGRQVATRERLEVLGLAMRAAVPDGLPLRETLDRINAAGGFPVLPWAPGKWLFGRGRLIQELLEERRSGAPALGDSSLRPCHWPEPALLRAARRRGIAVLPGSDPLPLPGEERHLGAYGFFYEGPFEREHPTAAVRAMLTANPALIVPAGRRNSSLEVAVRLYRLRQAKKDAARNSYHEQ